MKEKICLFILAVVLITSCQQSKKETESTEDTTAVTNEPSEVQLSEQQKAEGWKLLFNGKNTEGWQIFKNKENNSWEVVDGTLHAKPVEIADKRADIMTSDEYENFELAFDWKVAPGHNSGVMFRVTEEFDEAFLSGPEYQVIDDEGYPGDPLKDTQLTGSNYDMHAAPADKPVSPVGDWNSSRLIVNGNHVEHWLNGSKVVEYELNSDDWKKRKNASKWKDAKGYGMAKKGHIDFQDHGGEVWYRNIMIKTL